MNTDHTYASLGPCEDYEFDLVEWIDGALPPERAHVVRRHLDSCTRCRAFERQMRAIDASLHAALPNVQLATGFDARLQARIAELARARNPDDARIRAEQDYRGAMAELRRGLAWRTALNALATASMVGSVAVGVMTAVPQVSYALGLDLSLGQAWGFGVGAIALAAGAAAARFARSGGPSLFA
jgi:anti-sigma factor RsiW